MQILLLGSTGMLGSEIVRNLKKINGVNVYTPLKEEMDITSFNSVEEFFSKSSIIFDYVINCAAYTNVNEAEGIDNFNDVVSLNGLSCYNIGLACSKYKSHLIHFSTDFVFDGESDTPYKEEDYCSPLNTYGLSKMIGEFFIKKAMRKTKAYTIFRVQWLYGEGKDNFFTKILKISKEKNSLSVYDNEFGCPCSVSFVADILKSILIDVPKDKITGEVFHLSHDNYCSRYACATLFFKLKGIDTVIKPNHCVFDSDSFIERPLWGVLDNSKLVNVLRRRLGTWEEDLILYSSKLKG